MHEYPYTSSLIHEISYRALKNHDLNYLVHFIAQIALTESSLRPFPFLHRFLPRNRVNDEVVTFK